MDNVLYQIFTIYFPVIFMETICLHKDYMCINNVFTGGKDQHQWLFSKQVICQSRTVLLWSIYFILSVKLLYCNLWHSEASKFFFFFNFSSEPTRNQRKVYKGYLHFILNITIHVLWNGWNLLQTTCCCSK